MVTKKVVDLLNLQIQRELYSAYLYLDMALYYNDLGLVGHANWFEIQVQEKETTPSVSSAICSTSVKGRFSMSSISHPSLIKIPANP